MPINVTGGHVPGAPKVGIFGVTPSHQADDFPFAADAARAVQGPGEGRTYPKGRRRPAGGTSDNHGPSAACRARGERVRGGGVGALDVSPRYM